MCSSEDAWFLWPMHHSLILLSCTITFLIYTSPSCILLTSSVDVSLISVHLIIPFLFNSFHIVIVLALTVDEWMKEGIEINEREKTKWKKGDWKGRDQRCERMRNKHYGKGQKMLYGKQHEGHFTCKSHSVAEWMRRVKAFGVKWNLSHPAWELFKTLD